MRFIKKTLEYKSIQADSKKLVGKYFIVLYKRNNDSELAVGITVTKKIGNAVIRNKIKRRVKAFLRLKGSNFDYAAKVIFIAKANSATANWNDFCQSLELLLKKIEFKTKLLV